LSIEKRTNPTDNVAIEFPLNESRMRVSGTVSHGVYKLDFDIPDGSHATALEAVRFVENGQQYKLAAFVEHVLRPLLFPQYTE
jgi:hypothetical protein